MPITPLARPDSDTPATAPNPATVKSLPLPNQPAMRMTPTLSQTEFSAAASQYQKDIEAAKAEVARLKAALKSPGAGSAGAAASLALAEAKLASLMAKKGAPEAVRAAGVASGIDTAVLPGGVDKTITPYEDSSSLLNPQYTGAKKDNTETPYEDSSSMLNPAWKPAAKPAAKASPASPAAPDVPAEWEYGDKAREFEEAEANRQEVTGDAIWPEGYGPKAESPPPATPVNPEVVKAATKGVPRSSPQFGRILTDLAGKYGTRLIDILQAVGYQRGGIDKATNLEKKYQEKIDAEQRAYMDKLESERAAREESQYNKRTADERTYQAQEASTQRNFQALQAEADRIAQKEALGLELTSREKIAKMEIAATLASQKATAQVQPMASLIPEVRG